MNSIVLPVNDTRLEIKDGQLVSLEIKGEPVDIETLGQFFLHYKYGEITSWNTRFADKNKKKEASNGS